MASAFMQLVMAGILAAVIALLILLKDSKGQKKFPLIVLGLVIAGVSAGGGLFVSLVLSIQALIGPFSLVVILPAVLAATVFSLFFKKCLLPQKSVFPEQSSPMPSVQYQVMPARPQETQGQAPADVVQPGSYRENETAAPQKKKSKTGLIAIAVVLIVALIGGLALSGGREEILSLGITCSADGVYFTLDDFCLAERTDHDTYNPYAIDGASWGANDGYIFAYLNYRIVNQEYDTFDHFMDMDITVEFRGAVYGASLGEYKASSEGEDPYNLDVAPNSAKTYHHVISSCAEAMAYMNPDENVRVVVELCGKKYVYEIPASEIVVTKGEEVNNSSNVPFVKADADTEQWVRQLLGNNATYNWKDGNVQCQLVFTDAEVTLKQTLAGTTYTSKGAYEVGTEYLRVNYGGGDVYYRWDYNEAGYLNIYLVK